MLAENKVRGQIARGPWLKQSRCLRTELIQEVAQLCSLHGVHKQVGHIAGV